MKLFDSDIGFPADLKLSFHKLLDSIEGRLEKAGSHERSYLKAVLKSVEAHPELRTSVRPEDLGRLQTVIDELMAVVFPQDLTLNEIKAAGRPWDFKPFYTSDRLQNLLDDAPDDFEWKFHGLSDEQLYISGCSAILGMYYQLPVNASRPFYLEIKNKKTGKNRYYRMAFNADFLDITPGSNAIDITQEDYHELIDNFHDISIWKEKFPIGSWIFSGFSILNFMDLTVDQHVNTITNDLLSAGPDGMQKLRVHLSELLDVDDLRISFVNLEGASLMQRDDARMRAIILGDEEKVPCKELFCPDTYTQLIENDHPIAFPDIDKYAQRSQSLMAKNLHASGVKSYFVSPIKYDGLTMGFLELGSAKKGVLNATTFVALEQVTPILGVAGNRFRQEYRNRIEAVIQAECTTIHPAVKWRFEEEAIKHIQAEERGEKHNFKDLVFRDVYPLFGQLDIRGSSLIRNEGIKKDLQTQLKAVINIVSLAHTINPMPLYEEMMHVLENHHQQLNTGMVSSSEQDILHYIGREIHPVLDHLASTDLKLSEAVSEYRKKLHPEHGFIYNERASFDRAVNTLNKALSSLIDQKQVAAQAMFPHHFERYSTDGLEFNMYIGDSISPSHEFHPIMVKNLRLWQLIVMVEMEREYHQVRDTLENPLSVAALVLAHSTPLSIQYRMDEKQFDVEGAYNARYEIIKKRIDKAHIKGTNERITEPGQMVVVYATDEDEREYLRYYTYLQSKGYLIKGTPELLTLEDLQGVSGLKALRLGIDFQDENECDEISMEEILIEIEKKELN